jgi:zinc transport system substrate-binding protein
MGDALAASDAAVIDCSEGIELLPALGHEGHDHDTEYDPHIWMCEESALVMMNNILHGLGALDEKNLDCYRENAAAAAALVPEDDARMENLACPYLITFHDGFQYFALDNGLNLLKSIEEEEGAEASAAEIQEVVDLVREYEIPAIFTERNGSEATARAISRETGCAVYQLDMIMSGDGTGIQPYLDAMQKNIDTIAEALG